MTPTRVTASNGKPIIEHIEETFVQTQIAVNKTFGLQTTGISAFVPFHFSQNYIVDFLASGTEIFQPRPPPPRHPCRASQSFASPVVEGLDLYLPYLKHIWRLASIKTVCAWKLPSKTALYQWTFMRPQRCGEEKKM